MTMGEDVKGCVLEEVGTAFTILRDSGNVTGEYLLYAGNAQVTKPFIREFFLEGVFAYDTVATGGDIVQFNVTGTKYMVMNMTPEMLLDEVFQNSGVLYKCNVTADILRPSEGDWSTQTYHRRTIWTTIASAQPLIITTPLYGHDLLTDQEVGLLGVEAHEMYVPTALGVQALDRIRLSSTEYYRVETVKPRRYSGVDVVELGEDTRAVTTTTTTTTSSSTSTTTTTSP